jgi:hypothetical protein
MNETRLNEKLSAQGEDWFVTPRYVSHARLCGATLSAMSAATFPNGVVYISRRDSTVSRAMKLGENKMATSWKFSWWVVIIKKN